MKRLFILVSVLFACFNARAQAPVIQWQKSLGGSSTEEAYCAQATSDGGYIIVGPSQSTDGQVTGHHATNSNYDYWVVKLNDTGSIQWENSFGGSNDDILWSVQQTTDGGYIVAGASESTDFDLSTCSIVEYDYWLLKLSSTGSVIWKNCFGGHGGGAFNEAYSVQETPDADFIVAGYTNSTDSDEVTGEHGNNDYWVAKVSSTGGFLWSKCLGGSANDIGRCIQNTADGGFIVAGTTASANGQVTGFHGGPTDYWVVKLDDTGGLQWEKCYGGTAEDDGKAIIQTLDGGYAVAGSSYSINDEVTGHHGDTTTADFWIVKINDTGGIQWETSLGGSQNDVAYSIQQTVDSGYIVTGSSNSTDGQVTGNHGSDDYWMVKVGKDGAFQWEKSYGGSGTDDPYSIHQTADSGFIIAGGSNSTDGDITGNHGAYDFWLVKLAHCTLAASPVITRAGFVLSTTVPYASYKWELNGAAIPGATSSGYIITSNGNYTVFVTDTNGCSGISSTAYKVVGVKTIYNNKTISIAPNPTTGIVNITGADMPGVKVCNMVGQVVKEVSGADQFSIADLPPALYIVKLFDKDGSLMWQDKLLKQ